MPVQNFERFVERMANEDMTNNPALRERLKNSVLNADRAEMTSIGKEYGYDFTVEDIQTFYEAHAGESSELSEEDLENVAGGTSGSAIVSAAIVAVYGGPAIVVYGGPVATGQW